MPFSRPHQTVVDLKLQPGTLVADLGAGIGAYTVPLAQAVGPKGRVYAVEVQKELLQKIVTVTRDVGLDNVEVIWGDIENMGGTKLADDSVQFVVLANVLFQLENKEGCAREVDRILKPGGKVLVVDWRDSYDGMGPIPEMVLEQHRAREIFEHAGFHYENGVETGDQHYGFVCSTQH
jgi:ubiquinone/menaquinone biosynthesis C-methylase UbiE